MSGNIIAICLTVIIVTGIVCFARYLESNMDPMTEFDLQQVKKRLDALEERSGDEEERSRHLHGGA